ALGLGPGGDATPLALRRAVRLTGAASRGPGVPATSLGPPMASGPTAFQAPVGTQDVLPPESARWQRAIATFAELAGRYGFGLVHGPLFEDLDVFRRLGAGTDVVRKEMYDFR